MQNLRELLKEGEGGFGYSLSRQYPYLVEMLHRLTELPQFAQIEQPALNRADGYKTTDKNPYKAHPQDGPPPILNTTARDRLWYASSAFPIVKAFLRTSRAMAEDMCSTAVARTIPDVMNLTRN